MSSALIVATWYDLVAQARALPREQSKEEVEEELTDQESEPWEVVHGKFYKDELVLLNRHW